MRTSDNMSRVFQVETSRRPLDVSSANVYGEIITVFDAAAKNKRSWPNVFLVEEFSRVFLERLEECAFNADDDYLLVTGTTLSVSLGFASLVAKYHKARLLVFNANTSEYVEKVYDAESVLSKGDTSCLHRSTATIK